MMIKFSYIRSIMTLKLSIYFPSISFNFEHDNSTFMKQIGINNKNTFVFSRSNDFTFIKICFTLCHNDWKQVRILMSFVGTDVLRYVVLSAGWLRKICDFFHYVHDISDLNVNIAVKKLQIPLLYVHPFTTHLFDFITNFWGL